MDSTSDARRPSAGRVDALRAAVRVASAPAKVASLLLALEALALLALGVLQMLRGFGSGIDDVSRAEMGGLLALLGGVGVGVLAVGVLRRGASFRSPTLVVQLLCLPVGWALVQAGLYGYGIPLLVIPVVIVVALLLAGGFGPSAPDVPRTGPAAPGTSSPGRGGGSTDRGTGPADRAS
ncbi:Integral membrane protein [Frankia sp. AiPs1]|uniref:hypothetical protein n=1 Tax=Frankia sp. AiPa1 TaxID=573492 RepID=UPI00202AFF61|nr:hypothetical protein [Frankia sp. AiPa1]MCL9761228.1 hypothetical protein [Frankia sp. AiPa1]